MSDSNPPHPSGGHRRAKLGTGAWLRLGRASRSDGFSLGRRLVFGVLALVLLFGGIGGVGGALVGRLSEVQQNDNANFPQVGRVHHGQRAGEEVLHRPGRAALSRRRGRDSGLTEADRAAITAFLAAPAEPADRRRVVGDAGVLSSPHRRPFCRARTARPSSSR